VAAPRVAQLHLGAIRSPGVMLPRPRIGRAAEQRTPESPTLGTGLEVTVSESRRKRWCLRGATAGAMAASTTMETWTWRHMRENASVLTHDRQHRAIGARFSECNVARRSASRRHRQRSVTRVGLPPLRRAPPRCPRRARRDQHLGAENALHRANPVGRFGGSSEHGTPGGANFPVSSTASRNRRYRGPIRERAFQLSRVCGGLEMLAERGRAGCSIPEILNQPRDSTR